MCSKAGPVNLVCDIALRKYVFSRLKGHTSLSHSHVVTGEVENILRHSVMLGYIVWCTSFKITDAVVGTTLARSGGILPYKRLMGMCRWMGSHFQDWVDSWGTIFGRVTRMGSHIF